MPANSHAAIMTEVRPGVFMGEPLPEGVTVLEGPAVVYAEILCSDHQWRRVHGPAVKWHYVDGQLVYKEEQEPLFNG